MPLSRVISFFPLWGVCGSGEDSKVMSQGNLKGHTGSYSLSNLNHFQFAYILTSLSKGKALVGGSSDLRGAKPAGSFSLYFLAITSASANTFCQKEWIFSINEIGWKQYIAHIRNLNCEKNIKNISTSLFDINRPGSLSRSAILQDTSKIITSAYLVLPFGIGKNFLTKGF